MNRKNLISFMNQYAEEYSAWGGAYINWGLPTGLSGKAVLKKPIWHELDKRKTSEITFKRLDLYKGSRVVNNLVSFYAYNMRISFCGQTELFNITSLVIE
jgi:hypothetical protein